MNYGLINQLLIDFLFRLNSRRHAIDYRVLQEHRSSLKLL